MPNTWQPAASGSAGAYGCATIRVWLLSAHKARRELSCRHTVGAQFGARPHHCLLLQPAEKLPVNKSQIRAKVLAT